ncbi:MAG: 4Fe-4S binding protein [Chloroflexi bacterium]|jgi:NADP-reducing hydrogenase subunit HndD|nr:4Fe-4S binding protein [Chloroflexota bacterium]MBT3671083.1 4Fe-4S binding protein [Chloroflexota bacterium]MBT4003043.1 4Fe-4S binding protein [Chloroflexota bacterium]MBT4304898.1 4Fe-4S binding protein [Chloroflexota bacterium]MBT4534014.1 4Fe-4S binding protein [Chloroflexota bacterium]
MVKKGNVSIKINDQDIEVDGKLTLMEAISQAGENTPVICFHEATTPEGLCRLCVVEVDGWRVLAPACITQVSDGMVIHTNSDRVTRSRRTILEMLNASTDLSQANEIKGQIATYGVDRNRFPGAVRRNYEVLDDNPFYVRDYDKCILCWRCVQACGDDLQFTYALSVGGRGYETKIATSYASPIPETSCVFCGNCVAVCPTDALRSKTEFFLEQGLDYDQIRLEKQKARRNTPKK